MLRQKCISAFMFKWFWKSQRLVSVAVSKRKRERKRERGRERVVLFVRECNWEREWVRLPSQMLFVHKKRDGRISRRNLSKFLFLRISQYHCGCIGSFLQNWLTKYTHSKELSSENLIWSFASYLCYSTWFTNSSLTLFFIWWLRLDAIALSSVRILGGH